MVISAARKRRPTSRPALPGPRPRRASIEPRPITLDDLRDTPSRLLGLGDLILLGVIPSYEAYYKQSKAGRFPKGKTLPSRMLVWEARQIIDWYELLDCGDRNHVPKSPNCKPSSLPPSKH